MFEAAFGIKHPEAALYWQSWKCVVRCCTRTSQQQDQYLGFQLQSLKLSSSLRALTRVSLIGPPNHSLHLLTIHYYKAGTVLLWRFGCSVLTLGQLHESAQSSGV